MRLLLILLAALWVLYEVYQQNRKDEFSHKL